MQQLDQRTQELGRSVDQLHGLSEVGQAVSSSLDPQEVLSTIVKHAVELSGTEGGSIFEFDEVSQEFQIRTAYGTSDELLEALRATKVGLTTRLSAAQPRPAPRSPSPISTELRRTII